MIKSSYIRNVAVLGHQSSGKTSLVESLYHVFSGKEKGEVERKNTISDYLAEEHERLSSISSSVVPFNVGDYKINLIDIPGNDDFIGETIQTLKVVKGAILVIDASKGVEIQTIKHFNMLRKRNIPTIIFINKMDKVNIKYDDLLDSIREQLGKNVVSFCYPMGHEDNFDGFVNVIEMKARKYNGRECEDAEIYNDKKIKVLELHNVIEEVVAQTSDELLDKFIMGEALTKEEVHSGLRENVLNGEIIPIVCGSAIKNIGIHTLSNMLIDYLPTPSDLNEIKGLDKFGNTVSRKTLEEEPFSALVFKTMVDPYTGVSNVFKVFSGVLNVGDEVYCSKSEKIEKVSQLYSILGKTLTPVSSVTAGDIAVITKISDLSSGMSLSSAKDIIIYKEISYPSSVYFKAIEPINKKDDDKLGSALNKLMLEEKSLSVIRNKETKQLLIGGLSQGHINYILQKMKSIYKVEVKLSDPLISYRETIKKPNSAVGRYVKQSGGSGFYGVVEMEFRPSDSNSFVEEIFGGSVPRNYFPAVEKGVFEAYESGLLAGFPVINCLAILKDGKYHSVDSNELAFKMAAILAFKEAYMNCSPTILEPIIKVEVNVGENNIGDVLSDLNQRRAKVISMNETQIVALVPEAEIIEYVNDLKSITQGSAYFNREFYGYEEVPSYLIDKVISENKLN